MAREATTNIQRAEKSGVPAFPEQTRPGAVYTPATDIFENDNSITVLADMPGVKAADLKVDLRENVLTLTGRVAAPENAGESVIMREYQSGVFFGNSRRPRRSIKRRSMPSWQTVCSGSSCPRWSGRGRVRSW
jgi:HSP20 family molecular chaperone IbpA